VISREEVMHVAELARLHVEDDEVPRLQEELSRIMEYVQRLSELELEEVPPTTRAAPLKNVFRRDEVKSCLSQENAVSNAPAAKDGQFLVPRIG